MPVQTIIMAETLFDGKKKDDNCYIVIEGDKITDITKKRSGTIIQALSRLLLLMRIPTSGCTGAVSLIARVKATTA